MAAEPDDRPETWLLTIVELAHRSRLSVTQIRRLVKAGKIRCLQPDGRGGKLLFPPDALLNLPEHTGQSNPAPPVRTRYGRRPKWQN